MEQNVGSIIDPISRIVVQTMVSAVKYRTKLPDVHVEMIVKAIVVREK